MILVRFLLCASLCINTAISSANQTTTLLNKLSSLETSIINQLPAKKSTFNIAAHLNPFFKQLTTQEPTFASRYYSLLQTLAAHYKFKYKKITDVIPLLIKEYALPQTEEIKALITLTLIHAILTTNNSPSTTTKIALSLCHECIKSIQEALGLQKKQWDKKKYLLLCLVGITITIGIYIAYKIHKAEKATTTLREEIAKQQQEINQLNKQLAESQESLIQLTATSSTLNRATKELKQQISSLDSTTVEHASFAQALDHETVSLKKTIATTLNTLLREIQKQHEVYEKNYLNMIKILDESLEEAEKAEQETGFLTTPLPFSCEDISKTIGILGSALTIFERSGHLYNRFNNVAGSSTTHQSTESELRARLDKLHDYV